MNRNLEEELDVPIGPDNSFKSGRPDQGQPTHFLPRRNRFVFRVRVPKGFTDKDELIWTLTTYGKTEKAYATLRPDYKVDDVVKASETGALGAGTSSPEVLFKQAAVGQGRRTRGAQCEGGRMGDAHRGSEGRRIPVRPTRCVSRPRRRVWQRSPHCSARRRATRRWCRPLASPSARGSACTSRGNLYRGPGTATFNPPQVKAWEDTRAGANSPWAPLWSAPKLPEDGKVPVMVSFDTPGTYVLRCLADDALMAGEDVTIVVVRE